MRHEQARATTAFGGCGGGGRRFVGGCRRFVGACSRRLVDVVLLALLSFQGVHERPRALRPLVAALVAVERHRVDGDDVHPADRGDERGGSEGGFVPRGDAREPGEVVRVADVVVAVDGEVARVCGAAVPLLVRVLVFVLVLVLVGGVVLRPPRPSEDSVEPVAYALERARVRGGVSSVGEVAEEEDAVRAPREEGAAERAMLERVRDALDDRERPRRRGGEGRVRRRVRELRVRDDRDAHHVGGGDRRERRPRARPPREVESQNLPPQHEGIHAASATRARRACVGSKPKKGRTREGRADEERPERTPIARRARAAARLRACAARSARAETTRAIVVYQAGEELRCRAEPTRVVFTFRPPLRASDARRRPSGTTLRSPCCYE